MLTQTTVEENQKKISEEYNSIHLNIRKFVQLTRERYCWKLWVCETEQSFEVLGCGRQERKKDSNKQWECTKTKMRVKEQNNRKFLDSIEQWNDILLYGQRVHQYRHMEQNLSRSELCNIVCLCVCVCVCVCGYLQHWNICVPSIKVNTCASSIL